MFANYQDNSCQIDIQLDNSLDNNKKIVKNLKRKKNDQIASNCAEKKSFEPFISEEDIENQTENQKVFQYIKQYVSGQENSIKSLISIIASRDRRNKLESSALKDSIKPSHAIFHGPTGCGKSYLISKLAEYKQIPFIKTEATQYTEVGYVGRDVEMMVKDLIEKSIELVKQKYLGEIEKQVKKNVTKQILHKILGPDITEETFELFSQKLSRGELDEKEIEIEVSQESSPAMTTIDIPGGNSHAQIGMMNFGDIIGKMLGKKNTRKIKTNVKEAFETLEEEESAQLLAELQTQIVKEAIALASNEGIIFIDEIDKIITSSNVTSSRGEVSKEGVQRDLLPLLDGTTLNTKYGPIKTDHILFIAAGAFHMSKFSDLLPELQGRFPMHIKLHPLNEQNFIEILKYKKHSLITQHKAMMCVDQVELEFTEDAILEIAKITAQMNRDVENTGARRLRTIIDKVMEDLNFEAEKYKNKSFTIDAAYISQKMKSILVELDLQKFIL